ncbi:MAG: transcription antitermination factor NusB [Acidimicrobiales bacterium]
MTGRNDGPGSRREARERAVELAYEADMRSVPVDDLLRRLPLPPAEFTVELLHAGEARRDEADALVTEYATGWTLERMPTMDRVVMRLAVAEMLTADTPTGVILAEAVDLAGRFSTDESSRFVNGVLAAIARRVRP